MKIGSTGVLVHHEVETEEDCLAEDVAESVRTGSSTTAEAWLRVVAIIHELQWGLEKCPEEFEPLLGNPEEREDLDDCVMREERVPRIEDGMEACHFIMQLCGSERAWSETDEGNADISIAQRIIHLEQQSLHTRPHKPKQKFFQEKWRGQAPVLPMRQAS